MHAINKKGTALLAVIGFIILTAIIAEAFLLYFYNQYRITLQKILFEKAFYIALSGIEWAKVLIKTQDSRLDNIGDTVIINNWGEVFPEFDLRYAHQANEYPDLPYSFRLIIKRIALDRLAAYSETEIEVFGGFKIFANRRIDVVLRTEVDPGPPPVTIVLPEEEHWEEIIPASLP